MQIKRKIKRQWRILRARLFPVTPIVEPANNLDWRREQIIEEENNPRLMTENEQFAHIRKQLKGILR